MGISNLIKFACVRYKMLKVLFWQLVVFIAQLLDDEVIARVEDGQVASSMQVGRVDESHASGAQLDAYLARQWCASRAVVTDLALVRCISFSSDKSHVGGLPLQSTFMQFDRSNVVVPAFPQVSAFCVCGSVRCQQSSGGSV